MIEETLLLHLATLLQVFNVKVVRKDKGSTEVDTEGREEFNKEIHFIVPKDTTVTRADRVTYDSEYYNIRNVYNVRDRFGATMFKKDYCRFGLLMANKAVLRTSKRTFRKVKGGFSGKKRYKNVSEIKNSQI